jgi:hypothetical protein
MKRDPFRVGLALLLLVSAGLFITGSIMERGLREAVPKSTETGGETSGEGSAHTEAVKASERLFGLDLERPGIVAAASVVTLALAGLGLAWRDRRALLLIALFAIAFAVLDVREAIHQSSESRTSLLVLASVLATIHVITAILAGAGARRAPRGSVVAT